MKTGLKFILVFLGYVAAIGSGLLVGYLHERFAPPDAANYSGMYAEGTAIAFYWVSGIACIFPTALALFFLRKVLWFWNLYSWALLGLAATGPLLEVIAVLLNGFLVTGPESLKDPFLALMFFLVLVRLFGIIILAPADLLSALLSPDPRYRRRLFIAFGIECALGVFVALNLAIRHKFM